MSDIALVYDNDAGHADFALSADDLLTDDGLETSVFLSLFTGGPSGWWGDAVPDVPGDRFGSRLHELDREKDLPAVLERAPTLVEESLAWLVEDQVASSVSVTAASLPYGDGRSILALTVIITRPTLAPAVYRYAYNWRAQELARAV